MLRNILAAMVRYWLLIYVWYYIQYLTKGNFCAHINTHICIYTICTDFIHYASITLSDIIMRVNLWQNAEKRKKLHKKFISTCAKDTLCFVRDQRQQLYLISEAWKLPVFLRKFIKSNVFSRSIQKSYTQVELYGLNTFYLEIHIYIYAYMYMHPTIISEKGGREFEGELGGIYGRI